MKSKGVLTVQSLIICIVFNGILAGLIFLMANKIVDGLNEWASPFMQPGAPNLPEEVRSALSSLGNFIAQLREYLAPVLAAMTSAITLLLWFFVSLAGRRQIDRTALQAASCQTVQQPIEK